MNNKANILVYDQGIEYKTRLNTWKFISNTKYPWM